MQSLGKPAEEWNPVPGKYGEIGTVCLEYPPSIGNRDGEKALGTNHPPELREDPPLVSHMFQNLERYGAVDRPTRQGDPFPVVLNRYYPAIQIPLTRVETEPAKIARVDIEPDDDGKIISEEQCLRSVPAAEIQKDAPLERREALYETVPAQNYEVVRFGRLAG